MKRLGRILFIVLGSLIAFVALLLFVVLPIVTRPDTELSELATAWQAEGQYIS